MQMPPSVSIGNQNASRMIVRLYRMHNVRIRHVGCRITCYRCSMACACVLDTLGEPCENGKTIEVPFVMWIRVCPRNHA